MRAATMWGVVGLTLSAGVMLAGCASGSGRTERGEAAITTMKETRDRTSSAQGEVDRTQQALSQLASPAPGDVGPAYRNLTRSIDDLEAAAERVGEQSREMRERGQQYLQAWEEEMARVESPEIRSSAAGRREAVRANYGQIAEATRQTREAYEPYIKQIKDIRTALANDLTPAGVQTVKPAIDRALASGDALEQRLAALGSRIDRVYAGLSGAPTSGQGPASGQQKPAQ